MITTDYEPTTSGTENVVYDDPWVTIITSHQQLEDLGEILDELFFEEPCFPKPEPICFPISKELKPNLPVLYSIWTRAPDFFLDNHHQGWYL